MVVAFLVVTVDFLVFFELLEEVDKAEGEEVREARLNALNEEFRRTAEDEGRDLKLWADLDIARDGRTLTIGRVRGDPVLEKVLTSEKLLEFMNLNGFGFQGQVARREFVPASTSVTIAFETLHCTPYIWMTRALIVVIVLVFMACVRTIWKSRSEVKPEEA